MASAGGILVVGGYGVVGRRIAAQLASGFPARVWIAGRDEQRARALYRVLGEGTRPRYVDVNDPASIETALEGVGTVIVCVMQRERHLLRFAVARGLAYTDLAPALAFWRGAQELHAEAQKTGARVLLGAGLVPGISNMMARRLAQMLGRVESIETAILLSLGDEYGPDSLRYMFEAVTEPWTVLENGQPRAASPFGEAKRVQFPAPLGSRTAYLFPWSDVAYYPSTLGATTALGRLALEPPWAGRVLAALLRTRARSWLKGPAFSRSSGRCIEQLGELYRKRPYFALTVTAGSDGRRLQASLAGRKQAEATAACAAELTRALAAAEVAEPGVWLPEQAIDPERFFESLAGLGFRPSFADTTSSSDHPASFLVRDAVHP